MRDYPKANVSDPVAWLHSTIITLGVIAERFDPYTLDGLQFDDIDISMLRIHDEIIDILRTMDRPT